MIKHSYLSTFDNFPHTQRIFSSAVSKEVIEARRTWQENGALVLHEFVIQQQLTHLYTFRERTEVLQFFKNHPQLILLVIGTHRKLKLYFPDAQLSLQFVADTDADYERKEMLYNNGDLVISIVTHLPPLEAVEKLKQFYENWWFHIADEVKNAEKISFHLECL